MTNTKLLSFEELLLPNKLNKPRNDTSSYFIEHLNIQKWKHGQRHKNNSILRCKLMISIPKMPWNFIKADRKYKIFNFYRKKTNLLRSKLSREDRATSQNKEIYLLRESRQMDHCKAANPWSSLCENNFCMKNALI